MSYWQFSLLTVYLFIWSQILAFIQIAIYLVNC